MPRSSLSRVQGYPQDGRRRRVKKDRYRDKERDTGWPSFFERGPFTLFFLGLLYPELYIQQSEKCSQLNIPSVITFIDMRFLPAKVLFSVHHLLFWRPIDITWPPFDKGWSAWTPEQWSFLKVFLLKFLAWVTLKAQSYIFMEQRFSRLQQRKNLLTQSLMLLMLRLLLVFPTSWLYALPGTQWIRDVRTWQ